MPREQELAMCDREIAKAEREVMETADIGAYVGLTDWQFERDMILAEAPYA